MLDQSRVATQMTKKSIVPSRLLVALLTACLLSGGCTTTRQLSLDPPPATRGERIPSGNHVMIVLNDGHKVKGDVVSSNDVGITIVTRAYAGARTLHGSRSGAPDAIRGARPASLTGPRDAIVQEHFIPFSQMQSLSIRHISSVRTAFAVVGGVIVAVAAYFYLVVAYRDCGGYGKECVS